MSFDIFRFGIFTPAMLRALARALDATAPVGERPKQREARAAKLLFLAHLGSGFAAHDAISAIPLLRQRALLLVGDKAAADTLVEQTLQIALTVVDAAPEEHQIGRWLAVLLEMKAAATKSEPTNRADVPNSEGSSAFHIVDVVADQQPSTGWSEDDGNGR